MTDEQKKAAYLREARRRYKATDKIHRKHAKAMRSLAEEVREHARMVGFAGSHDVANNAYAMVSNLYILAATTETGRIDNLRQIEAEIIEAGGGSVEREHEQRGSLDLPEDEEMNAGLSALLGEDSNDDLDF